MATVKLSHELEALVANMPIEVPDLNGDILGVFREQTSNTEAELSDDVVRTDHVVDASTEVSVRVHVPVDRDGPLPCVYSMHGGGYIIGSNAMDDTKFDRWCVELGIVGVSVDYRLAPETPFPGPIDDCYAGLAWTHEHAEELGIDPERIGIAGLSAGGGLCAALALMVRDRGEIPVQFQLLDCPMLDDRMITPSSQLDDLLVWSKVSNEFGWRSYLGDLYGGDVPSYAAAARADDLSGLPQAYVCVGGADGFRDEDIAYAHALGDAGVPTDLRVYAGAPHGVHMFAGTVIADRYEADQLGWLRVQLDRLAS